MLTMRIVASWLYAITKYGYPPSLSDTQRASQEIAELGYDYMELEGVSLPGVNEQNLGEIYAHRKSIRRWCEESNIQPVLFFPILPDIVNHDTTRRKVALEQFRQGVEIADFLGCDFVATDSYAPPLAYEAVDLQVDVLSYGTTFRARLPEDFVWRKHWNILVESMCICAEEAEKAGLRLVIEPRVGETVSNTDAMLRLFEDVGSNNFGAILDTGHLNAQKEILPLSVAKLGSKLFYVHVADNDGRDNLHLAPGKGSIDWDGLFATLRKTGYEGDVAVDVGKVPEVANEYRATLGFLTALAERHGFELQ
jgi:sugar phosphate isomerase/epimerase